MRIAHQKAPWERRVRNQGFQRLNGERRWAVE